MSGGSGRLAAAFLSCVAVVVGGCATASDTGAGDTTSSSAKPSTVAVSLRDGLYVLTGTQTCKSAQGGDPTSFPIFAGSSLAVSGDTATVMLRNDPLEASVTTDGDAFHISQTFDLSGNPVATVVGQAPGPLDLVLDLTGTSSSGGRTITGNGSDMGVNCEYKFTGRLFDGSEAPGTSGAGAPCGGRAALMSAIAAAPSPDQGSPTPEDVLVLALSSDGYWARFSIGQLAEGVAGCVAGKWSQTDPAVARAWWCKYNPRPDLVDQLEVDCDVPGGSTAPSTAVPNPTVPTTSGISASCDAAAALAATIALHPETTLRSPQAVLACEGEWAVVAYGNEVDFKEVLRWKDDQWVEAMQSDNVCAAPGVPPNVRLYACNTG